MNGRATDGAPAAGNTAISSPAPEANIGSALAQQAVTPESGGAAGAASQASPTTATVPPEAIPSGAGTEASTATSADSAASARADGHEGIRGEGIVIGVLLMTLALVAVRVSGPQMFSQVFESGIAWLGTAALVVVVAGLVIHMRRESVLRWLGLGDRHEILEPATEAFEALRTGSTAAAVDGAKRLASALARRYSIGMLRTWTTGAVVALLGGLVGLAGTTLLMEQNRLLQGQNQLLERQLAMATFDQMNRFRDLLRQSPRSVDGTPISGPDERPKDLHLWPNPDRSVVVQIVHLGIAEPRLVIPALRPLLQSRNSSIAAGAMFALEEILNNTASDSTIAALVSANGWRSFEGAMVTSTSLWQVNMPRTRLLRQGQLAGSDMTRANLRGADLEDANLRDVCLRSADLREATLRFAFLHGANLTGAMLQGADLQHVNSVLLATVRDGPQIRHLSPDAQGTGRVDHRLVGAFMHDCKLQHAELAHAKLYGAVMQRADLSDASFQHGDLRHVDLTDANLSRAHFDYCDLRSSWIGTHPDGSRRLVTSQDLASVAATHTGAVFGNAPLLRLDQVAKESGLNHFEDLPLDHLVGRGVIDEKDPKFRRFTVRVVRLPE